MSVVLIVRAQVCSEIYVRNYEAAEPKEEWEDRTRLYSLKHNLDYSAGHSKHHQTDVSNHSNWYLRGKESSDDSKL